MPRRAQELSKAPARAAGKGDDRFVVGPSNWAAIAAVLRLLEGDAALQGLLVEGPRGSGRTALVRWAAGQLPAATVVRVESDGTREDDHDAELELLRRRAGLSSVALVDDLDRIVEATGAGQAREILASFAKAGGRIIATALDDGADCRGVRRVLLDAMPRRCAFVSLFAPTPEMLADFVEAELGAASLRLPDGIGLSRLLAPLRSDFRLAAALVGSIRERSTSGKVARAEAEEAIRATAIRWASPGASLPIREARTTIEERLGRGAASRHALAYALRCKTRMSFQAIAAASGMKTASAAFKAVEKMAGRVRLDPELRKAVDEALRTLAGRGT